MEKLGCKIKIILIVTIVYQDNLFNNDLTKVGIPDYANKITISNVSTYKAPSNGIITGAINSVGDDVYYKIKRNNVNYVVARVRTVGVAYSDAICFPFFIIVKKDDILNFYPETAKTSDHCYFYPFM